MKKVLIVDDDDFILEYIDALLQDHYQTLIASDGLQGWQMYLDENPDLLVTDLVMPNLDGYDLIEKIRGKGSQIQIVVVTGAWDEVSERLETCDVTTVITKPFKNLMFLQAIEEAFGDGKSESVG